MRFSLCFLSLSVLLLFSWLPSSSASSYTAVIADATTHLPPPHKHAVVKGCNAAANANCPTIAVTGLAADGGWIPSAAATVTVNAPAGMTGFLVYVAAPNNKHVGTFTVTQGQAQLFDAATPAGSTLQHSSNAVQTKLVATWTAPAAAAGVSTPLVVTALVLHNTTSGNLLQTTLQQTAAAAAATTKAPAATTKAPATTAKPAATTTTAAVVPVTNCFITVPANPLTAAGLATPYILSLDPTGNQPCTMANTGAQAFVQGAIIDLATGIISVYNPLVITAGTKPAVKPTAPTIPATAVVAVWFGFNGNNLTLKNAPGTNSVTQGKCVNGVAGSTFTQFAYCNAPAFFNGVQNAIENGQIATATNAAAVTATTGVAPNVIVPAPGTAADGVQCPTLRDFFLVDMDQSDNLDVTYLVTAAGLTAQNTAANAKALAGTTTAINPGDNLLLTTLVNPALKCAPGFQAPDLANANTPANALPLSEIQAALFQGFPQASVPSADPMVLVNNNPSVTKINNFRVGVFQVPITILNQANVACYCKNMARTAPARLMKNQAALALSASFVAGQNLFLFLATRFNMAVGAGGLNCAQFGVTTAFNITNGQFMPTNFERQYTHERSVHANIHHRSTLANMKEAPYVWYPVAGAKGVSRMHVLNSAGDPTTITVDQNIIDSYANLDMSSILENMDHNQPLGLVLDAYAQPDLLAVTDPGTQTADNGGVAQVPDDTTTPFLQTTTGLAVIIAASAVGAIAIIGGIAFCYVKQRKQKYQNNVSTMAMGRV